MKIAKLVFVLLCFANVLFTDFNPSKYQIFITKIDNWNYQGKSYTHLYLSNNTEWSMSDKDWDVGKLSIPSGMEVFISTSSAESFRESYWIKTADGKKLFKAMPIDSKNLPTLISKNEICIKEGGWFSSAQYIYVWQLSDGSNWQLKQDSYYDRDNWKVGDHVIVSIKDGYKGWHLVNTDRNSRFKLPEQHLNNDNWMKPFRTMQLQVDVDSYVSP